MFKPNTVFVVGAGASKEFGLPVGAELSKRIVSNLSLADRDAWGPRYRDNVTERMLKGRAKEEQANGDAIGAAAQLIVKGLEHALSIDAFIDMHRDKPAVATIGKHQIALEILRAERASSLRVDRSNIYNRIDFAANRETWLHAFAEILLEKARATSPEELGAGVSIICFNYDRCIEHYLIEAISETLGLPYEQAHGIVYNFNIIHPYGSLGRLPVSRTAGGEGVPFADESEHADIWVISDGLSTFTEEMRDTDQLQKIHSAIAEAERVVFLGFGFQSQNVELLTPPAGGALKHMPVAMTTGFGLHQVAEREVSRRMRAVLKVSNTRRELIMRDTKCGDFMRHNKLALSAS